MTDEYDVIVVGAGIMGSATAYALSRRGRKVLLLERFEIGHRRGSSHGRSRIFRFSYPDESLVHMAMEARSLWQRLEEECSLDLLIPTGGIDLGNGVEDNLRALRACGATAESLSSDEVSARWPHLSVPEGIPALYSPDTAMILADRTWRVLSEGAVQRGTTLRTGERVASVDRRGSVVLEDGTEFRAGCVVVTAGAWARGLLSTAGIDISVRPTLETVAYFDIRDEPVPAVVEWADPLIYALTSPGQGLKVGEHIAGPSTDPDIDGAPDERSIERLKAWVSQRFSTADTEPLYAETCFYTNTEDESFVTERHDDVVIGSPCSGHGFKFAPLIGERLADLATS